ncbi:ribosome biogenesis GTP-binding protein YihA/YsxC [bacterium]|nr:ribosome biogenesis GTP-binding protein YihA/YsxC [bacterium]
MAYSFDHCKFLLSGTKKEHFPKEDFPIIVFAGRSNVGKSSLINHLFSKKNLAQTSSTPGKTALINYFLVGEGLFLVDLPGYGFAKKSKKEQDAWGRWISSFIEEKLDKITFAILIDSRHPPFPKDIELIQYLASLGKKPLVVFTKTDKLKGREKKKLKELPDELEGCKTVLYSTKNYSGKKLLINALKDMLENGSH